jgi:hypothetical protein
VRAFEMAAVKYKSYLAEEYENKPRNLTVMAIETGGSFSVCL